MLRLTFLFILAKVAIAVDPEIHEKYLTLPRQEFIEYFNSKNFSWTIQHYDRTFPFCAVLSPNLNKNLEYCDRNVLNDIPTNFDSREQWPQCETIKEINNQGDCGSCWTFGTANTASDRSCIHKGIHVHLAEQDFECQSRDVCQGGVPSDAFAFWQEKGLVTNKCKPYDIPKLRERTCHHECVDGSVSYDADKHFAEKVYAISSEADVIKSEIVKNGPIQAAFVVYVDFQDYKGGIYEHKYGAELGRHSVRVIGFGVEGDTEYWLVANSWDTTWGEQGTFRIKAYQEDIEFENGLYSGLPKN